MIEKIYAVWVYVSDLKKSLIFYQKKLGLKLKFIEKDNTWAEFDLGITSFALLQRPIEKGKVIPDKTHIMFETNDIEYSKSLLEKHKVKCIGDIRNEYYGKLLTIEDPDGHWIELFENKKHFLGLNIQKNNK